MHLSTLLVIQLVLTTSGLSTHDKYFHIMKKCQFIGDDPKIFDVQYKIQYYYNGQMQAQYNSSTETVSGYTNYGLQFADEVNRDPHYLLLRRNDLNYFCKVKAELIHKTMLTKTVIPQVQLRMERSKSIRGSTVFLCTAYNFYPREIRLTWLRNGHKIPHTSEIWMGDGNPSGAWSYRLHSHLEHSPAMGEVISCVVEHASLMEPKLYHLDTSYMETERLQLALGISWILLGFLVLAAGALFYWKRAIC